MGILGSEGLGLMKTTCTQMLPPKPHTRKPPGSSQTNTSKTDVVDDQTPYQEVCKKYYLPPAGCLIVPYQSVQCSFLNHFYHRAEQIMPRVEEGNAVISLNIPMTCTAMDRRVFLSNDSSSSLKDSCSQRPCYRSAQHLRLMEERH